MLHDREEFIWYSEQDNWAHLYLHDLNTGELKRQLTSGNWPVLEVQQVDEESGTLYFTAAGREGAILIIIIYTVWIWLAVSRSC